MTGIRDAMGCRVYPLHRLDRATSGVLLFALSSEVAGLFAPLFAEGRLRKRYWAMVRGWAPASGQVERDLKSMDNGRMQSARTVFETLARVEHPFPVGPHASTRYSLVEAMPSTGRRHQLRRHLRGLNHPVLNDAVHGDLRQNRAFREHFGVGRLLLHAMEIVAPDPRDGRELCLRAPLEPDMVGLCEAFGWPTKPALRGSPD